MYSRTLKSLFTVSNYFYKSERVLKVCIPVASRLFQCQIKNVEPSFIFSRSCTTLRPPNKDVLAEAKIAKYLEDPANEKHYKVLLLEVEVMRQNGENLPSVLKPRHWAELIELKSRSKRRRYLNFLFTVEKKKENEIEKKQQKAADRIRLLKEDENLPNHLKYKLGCNSLFIRFYDTTINSFYNWRLMRAMMFGQKLIMDCGYENDMSGQELKNCAKQMMLAFAANRTHDDPFDLIYCNLNPTSNLHLDFYSFIPTMYDPTFPITTTSKSYLDLFDKKKLVYLTPDCREELEKFDPDDIYIIGAIVDKVSGRPLSMAKAKREGIRMAKLPIDRYLDFGGGSGKSLTLNQTVDILADLRKSKNWEYALRHVPRRKLFANRQNMLEKKARQFLEQNKNAIYESTATDFSFHARKKFRIK